MSEIITTNQRQCHRVEDAFAPWAAVIYEDLHGDCIVAVAYDDGYYDWAVFTEDLLLVAEGGERYQEEAEGTAIGVAEDLTDLAEAA